MKQNLTADTILIATYLMKAMWQLGMQGLFILFDMIWNRLNRNQMIQHHCFLPTYTCKGQRCLKVLNMIHKTHILMKNV
jgi:hypothetical protein